MYGIVRFASRGVNSTLPPEAPARRVTSSWEYRRWLSRLFPGRPNLGRLTEVVLEGEVGSAHTKAPRRGLHEVLVAGRDAELHGVEWISEAHRDAHVVAIQLLADRDVR